MFKQLVLFIVCCAIAIFSNAQLVYSNIKIEYDSVWACNHLQLIPIRYKDKTAKDNNSTTPTNFISLAQAMQQKKVQVKENYFEGNADVRTLTIKNNSTQHVLVTDGELLQGGKQDRMITETKMIAPGKEAEYLNVFCIEKGRWSKKPKPFAHAGFAGSNVRKVADSTGIQQNVWTEIEKQFEHSNTTSTTYPYLQVQQKLLSKDTTCYNYFMNRLAKSDSSCIGFIAVSDTTIIGCDVFANAQLASSNFTNLVLAYQQAAVATGKPLSIAHNKLAAFADRLFATEESQKIFLQHHGKMFVQNKKPLHIVAYGN